MNPERLKQVSELYHAALECEPGARTELLNQADPEVRREVESLLAQPDGGLLNRPAWEHAGSLLADQTLTQLSAGAEMGPYRIEAAIGAGGMGEVYRAVDTRLNRPVAIKVLFSDVADPQARRRFQQEAKTASSLNHPHI